MPNLAVPGSLGKGVLLGPSRFPPHSLPCHGLTVLASTWTRASFLADGDTKNGRLQKTVRVRRGGGCLAPQAGEPWSS